MSPHRRIPNVIAIFDSYLRNTDDFLQQVIEPDPPIFHNWKRLGLSQESADEWHGRRMYWQDELYPKYRGAATKTKAVNGDVKNFMKDFIAFGSPLLNVMASSYAVTPADALLFRFKIGRNKRSRAVTPITEQCVPLIRPMGGGFIKIACRTIHDNGRPALVAGADSVLLVYTTGDTAPESSGDCTNKIIITRANSIQAIGEEHVGKRLYVYTRYYNTKRPELAGPFSNMASVILA